MSNGTGRGTARAKAAGVGMLMSGAGWLDLAELPIWHEAGGVLLVGGAVVVGGAIVAQVRSRKGSAKRISRRERRADATAGTTGMVDTMRARWRERGLSTVVRPDLDSSAFRRPRVSEWATPIARTNGVMLTLPLEQHTIRFGAPRSGKTSELAVRVLDAPGAVVSTSTRLDVLDLTAGPRAQYGEVALFAPGGDGGRVSTIKWTPVAGCDDVLVAQRRAAALIAPSPSPEREGWANDARDQLAVLLHAARLVDAPARQVSEWVSDLAGRNVERVRDGVEAALQDSPAADMMSAQFGQFAALNDRTRTSVTQMMMSGLRWLTDPRCSSIAEASPSGELFDPAEFFRGRNTLYLVGSDNGLHRPLTGALLDEIAAAGRERAKASPTGRLAVPTGLVLDELKLTTTAPLDSWTADFGGFGLYMHLSCQSLSQLRGIYGRERAEEILGNVGALILFRHGANVDDMQHWEQLAGTYSRPRSTKDGDGRVVSAADERVSALPASQLREFKPGEAAVFVGGQRVAVTTMPNVRDRDDVKRYAGANPFRPAPEPTSFAGTLSAAEAAAMAAREAE